MTTIQETLELLRAYAVRTSLRKVQNLKLQGAREMGVLEPSEVVVETLADVPDPSEALRRLAEESAGVKEAGTGIETGLNALTQGFGRLGLLNELFPPEPDLRTYEVVGEVEPVVPKSEILEPPSGTFYIDPETRAVIQGQLRGRLPRGHAMRFIQELHGQKPPMSQRDLAKATLGKAGDATLRSLRGKLHELNRGAKEQGLPPIIERGDPTGYTLSHEYALLNPDIFLSPGEETSQLRREDAQRPTTHSISEVVAELELRGIKGWSDVRIRRLAGELLKSGHVTVGNQVMEQIEGSRNLLVYTDAGIDFFEQIGREFPDFGKVYVESVKARLDEQSAQEATARALPTKEKLHFYYGSQVAEAAGIPPDALNVMHNIGVFEEGVHFVRKGARNIRVYTQEALPLAARVKARADEKGQSRFTEHLIRETFRIYEPPTKNPFGKNGPRTVSGTVELFLLQTIRTCLPAMHRRGVLLEEKDEDGLKKRIGALTEEVGYIEPDDVGAVRNLAAATAFDLIENQRPFNFLQKRHPGLRIVNSVIDSLKKTDTNLLVEFPNAVKEPPKVVPLQGSRGEVNGSILIGWMGDRR